jgi:hypothetical protein
VADLAAAFSSSSLAADAAPPPASAVGPVGRRSRAKAFQLSRWHRGLAAKPTWAARSDIVDCRFSSQVEWFEVRCCWRELPLAPNAKANPPKTGRREQARFHDTLNSPACSRSGSATVRAMVRGQIPACGCDAALARRRQTKSATPARCTTSRPARIRHGPRFASKPTSVVR